MRILVASEDEAERRVIRDALASRRDVGDVTYVGDGVEAYIAIRQARPDVAILSAALPRLDGIVLVRTVVRLPLRTILILSRDCSGRVREALEARPTGILVRPFGGDTFLDRFTAILSSDLPSSVRSKIRAPVA